MSQVHRYSQVVAVVGGGASGALVAAQLLRAAKAAGSEVEVRLIEPRTMVGRGVAYSTTHPDHLLNVPAGRMSAFPDDPDHFVAWLTDRYDTLAERQSGAAPDPNAFVPRGLYGEYIEEILEQVTASSPGKLRRIQDIVHEIHDRGSDYTIRLASGQRFRATDVVLALGAPRPDGSYLPQELTESPAFVADPWDDQKLQAVTADANSVLLVGSGLTMVDVALRLRRPGVRVTAVSRTGLSPYEHAPTGLPALPPPQLPSREALDLEETRRIVRRHIRRADEAGLPWQSAIDSLRPLTNEMWRRLSLADQNVFLAEDMRRWEVLRHRLAPQTAAARDAMAVTGELSVAAGEIGAVQSVDGQLLVRFRDGRSQRFDAVVACTGAGTLSNCAGPTSVLLGQMIADGLARPHPLGLGLDISDDGRVVQAGGQAAGHMWVVGHLRRGRLWETTAMPEIRTQAAQVGRDVVASRPRPKGPTRDLYGLALSTSALAADLYNEALGRVLRVQSGALESLQECLEVDPTFALAHAAIAVLGHEFGLPVDVTGHLDQAAMLSQTGTSERERAFVGAYRARVLGDGSPLRDYLDAHPRDTLAMSVAMPTIAFSGAYEVPEQAWGFLESKRHCYGSDWWYEGLLAFARQEQGRMGDALELAERSLAAEPRGGNAVHAKAHVHLETGEHVTGLAWLDEWVDDCGRDATHRAHFAWHAALHELALDDTDAVLRRYFRQLAPPEVCGTRAMVDSATLLWRLQMEEVDGPIPPASALVAVAGKELRQPLTAFAAMHAAITWAAAGQRDEVLRIANLCRRSSSAAMSSAAAIAEALAAYLSGDYERSADQLLAAHREAAVIGGSAAQREVLVDTAIAALIRSGDAQRATACIEARLSQRPRPRDRTLLRRVAVLQPRPAGFSATLSPVVAEAV